MTSLTDDILDCDALTLSRRIHGRIVSCREVMTATLGRIARLNPIFNAIVSQRPEEVLLREAEEMDDLLARGRSLGWMHGFPQAPKDLAQVAGLPTTHGSALFGHEPDAVDGYVVERIRANGAIFIGKTNTPEFGLGSQTYNGVFGATGCAYDPALTAGGSSGGAATALALRMLPVADGSDMMGSLRNPAAYNNIYGLRPSFGRVAKGPAPDLFFQQLGYEGPMARTVADLAMLLSVMAGPDPRAPLSLDEDPAPFAAPLCADVGGTRIGWLADIVDDLPFEDGILDLCSGALGQFAAMGCVVEEARADFSRERMWSSWCTLRHFIVSGGLAPLHGAPAARAKLKPEAIWEIEHGLALTGPQLFAASTARSAWYMRVLALFDRYDVLALPSAQVFAFDHTIPWPRTVAGQAMDTYHRWMEVVVPASLAGVPAISVPAGFSADGRAMGLQLIGKPKGDLALLRLAHAYDVATAWPERRPPPALV